VTTLALRHYFEDRRNDPQVTRIDQIVIA